ncbi:MAG: hypothetical protein RR914_05690, partial [Oscillospiraceae bacterium]
MKPEILCDNATKSEVKNNIKFSYSVSADTVLYHKDSEKRLELLKKANVSVIWLFGYFFGKFDASFSDMKLAKAKLEKLGFEVNVINLPFGHPGNSLDPTDGNVELCLPKDWTYRVNEDNEKVYYCGCANETLVKANKLAVKQLKENGFTKIFWDDDLRQGECSEKVQGCFCDDCIEKFNKQYKYNFTRLQLKEEIKNINSEITQNWIEFNCEKVTNFMREMNIEGVQNGIMVMFEGDERQGISIKNIKKELPNCLVRVGESHFSDEDFKDENVEYKIKNSIKKHMAEANDIDNV